MVKIPSNDPEYQRQYMREYRKKNKTLPSKGKVVKKTLPRTQHPDYILDGLKLVFNQIESRYKNKKNSSLEVLLTVLRDYFKI